MTKEDPRKIMVNGPVEPSAEEASSVESVKNNDNKLMHEKVILPVSVKKADDKPDDARAAGLPGEIKFTETDEDKAESAAEAPSPVEPAEPVAKDEPTKPETEASKADDSKEQASDNEADTSATSQDEGETSEPEQSQDEDTEEAPGFEPVWRKHQAVPNRKKSKKKIFKWIVIILILGFIAACAYPASRYWLLQKSPIKKSFEITFTDKKTGEPVDNLQVTINNNQQTTDEYGHAYFNDISLGKYNLDASRAGFAPINTTAILEPWTHYNLPNQALQVVGVRFHVQATDWLSGKPVTNVEAKYDSNVTKADTSGKLTIITPPLKDGKTQIALSAAGYHNQTVVLKADNTEPRPIKLVPASLDYFVSNRDGKYGVYSSWLDGTHQTQILSGTGNEKANSTQLMIAPNNEYAALITTRNNIENPTYPSQTINELFVLNLQDSQLTKVTNGPIVGVGWINDNFIYQATNAKKSYKAKDAAKLVSIKASDDHQTTLVTSNNFALNTNIIAGQIYYSPNDNFNNSKQAFFSRINPDGTGKQQLITDRIIDQISRLSYSNLQLQDQNEGVLDFNTSNNKSSSTTSNNTNNIYVPCPNGKSYVWVEQRDGKSALIMQTGSKQKVLYQAVGITNPIHWLDEDTIVFTVNNGSGVSDYVLSLNGGKSQKISDVSNLGVY